jgi:hypothetical protein
MTVLESLPDTVEVQGHDWEQPLPFPDTLLPVAPFVSALLPKAFEAWVMDIADRIQCPPDFPAIAAMVALATVVGRQVGIQPKQQDDWLVIPNLWGMVVGRPGVMKTPALSEPLKPLQRLEIQAKEAYQQEVMAHEAERMILEERKKQLKGKIGDALKNGQDAHALALGVLQDSNLSEVVRKRYIVNDTSVEKLGELLSGNPNGLLLYRDELPGFLESLDKPGCEGARAFYLESWNGTSRFTYDRIGRGTVEIESCCLSLLGGIQPGRAASFIRDAISQDDGLIQRFQMLVWPDIAKVWINVDRLPDTQARQGVYELFDRLTNLDVSAYPKNAQGIPYLKFSPEASKQFITWRTELEHRVRSGDEIPCLEAHFSKYRSLIPSLALLIHLCESNTDEISLDTLGRALAWGDYLETHARRFYGSETQAIYESAKKLLKRIQKGEVKSVFTSRDVYRNHWSGLADAASVNEALEKLEALNYVRSNPFQTGGRDKQIYEVNPLI